MLDDVHGAGEQVGLVVLDAVLGAERHDKHVGLGQRVAGHHGEQVVVHLVFEATAEPVHEPVAGNVTGSGDLQLPVVRASVGVVDREAVVAQGRDRKQDEAAHGLGEEVEPQGGGHGGALAAEGEHPSVVGNQQSLLQAALGARQKHALHLLQGLRRESEKSIRFENNEKNGREAAS